MRPYSALLFGTLLLLSFWPVLVRVARLARRWPVRGEVRRDETHVGLRPVTWMSPDECVAVRPEWRT